MSIGIGIGLRVRAVPRVAAVEADNFAVPLHHTAAADVADQEEETRSRHLHRYLLTLEPTLSYQGRPRTFMPVRLCLPGDSVVHNLALENHVSAAWHRI